MARDTSSRIRRGQAITLKVDDNEVTGFEGETIATVLLAAGITTFNHTPDGRPRGPYCNMGTCFECQVKMAPNAGQDHRWVRACMAPARDGMDIQTGVSRVRLPGREMKTGRDR